MAECFHLASEAHMELGCLTRAPELLSRDLFQKGRWSGSDLFLDASVFLQRAAQFDDR